MEQNLVQRTEETECAFMCYQKHQKHTDLKNDVFSVSRESPDDSVCAVGFKLKAIEPAFKFLGRVESDSGDNVGAL